jgi:hypothetical protein
MGSDHKRDEAPLEGHVVPARETSAGPGPALAPAPLSGLTVGRVDDPAEHLADALAETALARLQRLGPQAPAPGGGLGVRASAGAAGAGLLVIRRSPADYKQEYDRGYREEFWQGFRDGLDELVDEEVIARNVVNQIVQGHHYNIQYLPGWNSTYNARDAAWEHREHGYDSGKGAGFDQGYEEALATYGYTRKYNPIPPQNRQLALQDNGGMCVYCNAAANADVDHIEPLKVHWQTRGSTMGQAQRSAEANDTLNLVGACATCNRSKGSKRLKHGWDPPDWDAMDWWPHGPQRVEDDNSPPPYW